MISGIIFKSLIHFELIFLYSVRLGSVSYLSCMWLSSFPIYWRYYPLSLVCSLLFCHKLLAHICMGVFLDSRFCFIDLSVFLPIPCCSDYCGFAVWNQEVRYFQLCSFFSQNYFGWGLLWFHINLRIFSSISVKNVLGILLKDYIESADCFRQ